MHRDKPTLSMSESFSAKSTWAVLIIAIFMNRIKPVTSFPTICSGDSLYPGVSSNPTTACSRANANNPVIPLTVN